MVRFDCQYTTEDDAEASAAEAAALAGRMNAGGVAKPARSFKSGLLGWLMFVVMSVLLVLLVDRRHVPHGQPPKPTHPFGLTLVPALVAPLLLAAGVFFSQAWMIGRKRRAPFYQAPRPARDGRRIAALLLGWFCLASAVALLVWCGLLPTAPDWAPTRAKLVLVALAPWVVWAVVVITVLVLVAGGARRRAPETSSYYLPRSIGVTDDGVAVASALVAVKYRWGYFVSYLESQNLLLLYTADLQYVMLPKRALPSPDDLIHLRALVQNHIERGRFLPLESAFPVLPGLRAGPPAMPPPAPPTGHRQVPGQPISPDR